MTRLALSLCMVLLAGPQALAFRMESKDSKRQLKQQVAEKELLKAKLEAVEKELIKTKLNAEAMALAQQTALRRMDGKQLTQVLTTLVGLGTTMVSAFTEDPPDFEYAFDAMNMQGWKLIKQIVPKEHQSSADFRKASRAWRTAFDEAGEITEQLIESFQKGHTKAIIEAVLRVVGKALETTAKVVPKDGELILAINELAQGMAKSLLDFTTDLGWVDGGSLVQVMQADSLATATDGKMLTQLLTTGVGIVTTFVSAFSEDPPDFEYAFESMQLQGWKMVKLLVSKEDQRKDGFRQAQKAWNHAFSNAPEISEAIIKAKEGDIDATIRAVLRVVEIALTTAAKLVEADVAKILNGVGTLVVSLGDQWLTFASTVGWM